MNDWSWGISIGRSRAMRAVGKLLEVGERGVVGAGEFEFAAAVGVIDIDGALEGAGVQHCLTRHG